MKYLIGSNLSADQIRAAFERGTVSTTYRNVVHIGGPSVEVRTVKHNDGFRQHDLSCKNCRGTLTISDGLAICEFCSSQFYLEGYDGPNDMGREYEPYSPRHTPTPYSLDGGVSYRTAAASYAIWAD